MLTRVRLALVDVEFAALATVAGRAVAHELADAVLAGAAVEARVALALVHVAQAPGVEVAARAVALEAVHQVRALTCPFQVTLPLAQTLAQAIRYVRLGKATFGCIILC